MSQTTARPRPSCVRSRLPAPAGRVDGHVTLPRVVASEWLKFRTLRSTLLVLLAAMLAMVAFGAIIGHNTRQPGRSGPRGPGGLGPAAGLLPRTAADRLAGRPRGQRRVLARA